MRFINLLFNGILVSSIFGSFVTIVIIFIKKLFKNKLSASFHYYIWMLLILRLAIPYSVQSQLSIFNIFAKPLSNTEASLNIPIGKYRNPPQPAVKNGNTSLPNNTDKITKNTLTIIGPNIKTIKRGNLTLFNIASTIWLIVMLSTVLFIFIFSMLLNKRLKSLEICKDIETIDTLNSCKEITKINTYVPVTYVSNLNGASLYGISSPKILISDKIIHNFTVDQKRYIFLHELIHLKYKDILINRIMLILAVLNWFNPIIWYSFYRMQQDCELSCDEKVLYYLKPTCYNNYSNTIINMAALFSKSHNVFNSTSLISNKSNLKKRIVMIGSFKGRSVKRSITGIVLITLIGLVCLVNPKADARTAKELQDTDIISSNTNKSIAKSPQRANNTDESNNSSQAENKENYLSLLSIILPQNWSIDKNQQVSYDIKDAKGESRGSIDTADYVDNFDALTQMPNHSSVSKDEYIDIPLGKCRLITLDADNGTAASGITGTHDAYYATIPIKGKIIYILNFTENNTKSENRENFVKILKNLSIKISGEVEKNNEIKPLIFEDMKIGDVQIGNTIESIQKFYGDPSEKTTAHGIGSPLWYYKDYGLEISFYDTIWRIIVTEESVGSTPRGIHINSTSNELMNAYPDIKEIKDNTDLSVFSSDMKYSIHFSIKNDIVTSIMLEKSLVTYN